MFYKTKNKQQKHTTVIRFLLAFVEKEYVIMKKKFLKLTALIMTLIVLILTNCLIAFGTNTNPDIPEDALSYNGHYYKIYDINPASYEVAIEYCENLGGHLATIANDDENEILYSYMISCGFLNAYFGYTDRLVEGEWKWITDEEISYTNWHSGEPNGQNTKEDYAMFYSRYNNSEWNDGDFEYGKVVFICEWDSSEVHVHEYTSFAYIQSEHPHYSVYECSCGATMTSDIVNVVADCFTCHPTSIEVVNNPGTKNINYGDTLRLTAKVDNLPDGANICWYIDDVECGYGTAFYLSNAKENVTVTVKVLDKNGNVVLDSNGNEITDSEYVIVNSGIIQKIISFIKNIFGFDRVITQ